MEKLYCLIILFFFVNNYEIINNPYFIGSGEHPFLLSTESVDDNYVISSQKSFKLKKENGKIDDSVEINEFFYSSNFIHVVGKSFKNFIIDKERQTIFLIDYEHSITFVEKSEYSNLFESPNNEIIGSITRVKDINEDEISGTNFIVYGKSDKKLFFYTDDGKFYFSKALDNISDKLSCKFVEGNFFICLIFIDDMIDFHYIKFNKDSTEEHLKIIYSEPFETGISYFDLALYDTSERNLKFLCAKLEDRVHCIFFKVRYNSENKNEYFKDKSLSFDTNYFSQKNCDFTEFNSEYLFCCGDIDHIKCFRIDKKKYNHTEFHIPSEGENTYLNIQSSEDKIIFYYMNKNQEENNIYQYYIYKPNCSDINLIMSDKLTREGITEDYININDLFNIKTNTSFLTIENPNNEIKDIGYFTIDEEKLTFGKRRSFNKSVYKFNFNIDKTEKIEYDKQYVINYTISIERKVAYSAQCTIGLRFVSNTNCYYLCNNTF